MADERDTSDTYPSGSTVAWSPTETPKQIGPYKILEQVGEGGMGVVYLAEQTEPVHRRVALKIIKLGMDSRRVVARFEAERQALAMMDHPNVAKVLDAGATETGRPYFVMEHVAGVPITEHCDRQRLTIEERLKLFIQVCDATQHAHQKGIIHRDIKPSNILVTAKDGEGVPKVIDFGVVKALHQKLTERTLFTEEGQVIGTPEYMSPEQAEMTAQDIDTRSDIYSLGVLLYELLTGALPFARTALRRAARAEIQRIIREEVPPKPSTRLSGLGDESTTSAKQRRSDPKSLLHELRGDLDWITMKALEKDRTRRYATASEFAKDVQRHVMHEPVAAARPSLSYRLQKWIYRHKARAVALLVIGLLAALSAILATSAVSARAREAKATLAAERREEAQVLDWYVNDLELSGAERKRSNDVVGRLAARILAQEATAGETRRFIEAITEIRLRGRPIQPSNHLRISTMFETRPLPGMRLGVWVEPHLKMNGQALPLDGNDVQGFWLGLDRAADTYSVGVPITLSEGVSGVGSYVVAGTYEARLFRLSEEPEVDQEPQRLEAFVADPVTLVVPPFRFAVVETLPENYPVLVKDRTLGERIAKQLRIGPLVIIGGSKRQPRAEIAITVPEASVSLALELMVTLEYRARRWELEPQGIVAPSVST